MDKIRIRGGQRLEGQIPISGAKNAALPLLAACLLTDETLVLRNLPHLADIATMTHLLAQHGAELSMAGEHPGGGHMGHVLKLCAAHIASTEAPYDIVRKMRASVLVLGPLLARCGQARVSLPGGCAIGTRPVDMHIRGLETLGAEIELDDGYIVANAPDGLQGGVVVFPTVSVGATENMLMAATLAKGEVVLENAAREPEVADLANCLNQMGARIEGIGSDTLRIQGVARLSGTDYSVLPDRIEAATYAIAAAITGGDVELLGAQSETMEAVIAALEQAKVTVERTDCGIRVRADGATALEGIDVTTAPYPGFPTDLQAQMMTLMTVANGAAMITETIFENRFQHVPELMRMGADITVKGATAMVRGDHDGLHGAPVMATDLRASVSLVLAGLAARGETTINRVYHLDRGYERLEEKLSGCGADIARLVE
ncbi:MAG: UDP-N-acetylglucosamine 1-carboxyvinyltransferase [Rhodospirillaceae bacterium]|jgi:UDP-N-acetylglucosamine 1-carboxyvinyltransferase|nr:UDP-N-acetylglucosamine 1-carboxyvinyltransferase [Rhodospirillaceae bacterium]MBT5081892.1 UDP-N-acetylglucosamine 1-carboxyvinyltransferase [Rhodospirillaceae bacterium]MBT5523115.1 UDP-N-acetylglucosamine 1-carboxyvinyltransferase [Rhodospirillaceae bacterium]MBT5881515.1 UDP-N-acetylglucosamine 1-carboxyvinyltransferase [Rhodospirillaceae bacterium]MBT6588093.1 UDP-N-acetylglucosamine 1-carboxyvinyltransferase [Rhodospirillaceae bacterium]